MIEQTDINTGAPGAQAINSPPQDEAAPPDPRKLAEKWAKEVDAAERELKPFHDASRKVLQRYLDKRQQAPDFASVSQQVAPYLGGGGGSFNGGYAPVRLRL